MHLDPHALLVLVGVEELGSQIEPFVQRRDKAALVLPLPQVLIAVEAVVAR